MTSEKIVQLPNELHGLETLGSNFYYSWNRGIREVFVAVDRESWDRSGHNPITLLRKLSSERIEELRRDEKFLTLLQNAVKTQLEYLGRGSKWFATTYPSKEVREVEVAYFSMEFGIVSYLRIYSGGLGVLSGDHLKSSSDLGIPLVAIGLFYTRGYFSQGLNPDGWQMEHYPANNPEDLPLQILVNNDSKETLVFSVPIADREIKVRAWKAQVGTISLYLLDTNLPGLNSPEDCEITSELYGGDSDLRIKQEIVLGFGGARLLRVLGRTPSVFHMNEGHSSFVSLERISRAIEESNGKLSFREALETVKASTVFTTHTPVPAGIDIFTRGQMEHYLSQYPKHLGISAGDLFSLGQETTESNGFNMAVFAIRTASMVNGVSHLHGHVARKLWERILQEEEFDIEGSTSERKTGKRMRAVTNGVHVPSWISDSMASLFDEYLGNDWPLKDWRMDAWRGVSKIPSERLWEARQDSRAKLMDFISRRLDHSNNTLDHKALTVGFARRFATYKRATLLFSDPLRLERLLTDPEKPIQFVFAGKAHPRDHEGKKFIQEIISFVKKESTGGKIVFLPDYDIDVARNMVQGVDVWLNNPRRPMEASGTSGMKVLCNGGLNLSILDGWWNEAYTPSNGWAIGTGAAETNHALQDRQDAESLYDLLQNHVVQEFYERTNGLPVKWIDRMRRSISGLVPRFSSDRMVIEYAEDFYFRNLGKAAQDQGGKVEVAGLWAGND
jgi:glycogen phosphorylase